MQHLDRLIRQHPKLRAVDFQRLLLRMRSQPEAHWPELVRGSAPLAYSMALRLVGDRPEGAALAERATFELFSLLRADDFARLRSVVGFGRWPSLLLRWLRETSALADLPALAVPDREDPIPQPDEKVLRTLTAEGERLFEHMRRVLRALHRRDRLLLTLRYEQQLTMGEIEQIFRLGSPARVSSLLGRLEATLQPVRAVAEASQLDDTQRRALLAELVRRIFAATDMQSDEHRATALATAHR
jgi:hypothetical protein